MENIIVNQEALANFKKVITRDSLLVVSDFDRTLTYGWAGDQKTGRRAPSLISILRDEPGYLTSDYAKKAKAIADKYHPIELDFSLSREERKKAMDKWWQKAFELLFVSDFEKQDLEKAVKSPNLILRASAEKFLSLLKEKGIPLIFLSASGLGIPSIEIFLEQRSLMNDKIKVISNDFIFNEQGKAIGYKKPIVHTLNKGEIKPEDFGISKEILERKNLLLIGDSVDDTDMALPFRPESLLKIGFLDFDIENRLKKYKEAFDVVLLNNSPFDFINNLLINVNKN